MPRLYLVRHGRAAAGYGDHADPGLDELGHEQAAASAAQLADVGPIPMITSPLTRARETANALERRWNTVAVVDPAVGEIPSPSDDFAERQTWLQQALAATYADLGPRYSSWRTMVVEQLLRLHDDTVVFTHFVAINAAIGHAIGDDRVMISPVGNGSITVFEHDHRTLTLVETGEHDAAPIG